MTTKHTPGPWEWDGTVWNYDEAQEAPWLVQAGSDGRSYVLRGSIQANTEEDARLIAAAPELLSLLIESQTNIGGDWRDRRDALIAKATGESHGQR